MTINKPKIVNKNKGHNKMSDKINAYIQDRTETVEKVLTFHILNRIKKYYKTLDNYQSEKKDINKFNSLFYIDNKTIDKLIGCPRDENGKQIKVNKAIKDNLNARGKIRVLNHYTQTHKSGKQWIVYDRYILTDDYIKTIWDDERWFNADNKEIYTKEEHKLIDRLILGYKHTKKQTKAKQSNKTETMTKQPKYTIPTKEEIEQTLGRKNLSEEFIKAYQRECAEEYQIYYQTYQKNEDQKNINDIINAEFQKYRKKVIG